MKSNDYEEESWVEELPVESKKLLESLVSAQKATGYKFGRLRATPDPLQKNEIEAKIDAIIQENNSYFYVAQSNDQFGANEIVRLI